MRNVIFAGASVFVALSSVHAADAPRRIVSFNQCADQLVLALADPGQIVGLSPYAADPSLSVMAEPAKTPVPAEVFVH